MSLLLKVRQNVPQVQSIKTSLKKRAGQKIPHMLSNASDLFFRGSEIALSGKTPFDVIYKHEIISLRHYRIETEASAHKHRVPLVIVPPLAVNMLIYDLFPTRSLIRYFLDQGFEVYLIDWGVPTRNQAKYNFGTYVKVFMPEMLKQVRIHSRQQQLSLHGWSLGGALSLCYTALFKDKDIKNLMILASPIDTHKAGYMGKLYGSLTKPAQWVRKHTPFRIRQHVPSEVFHIHGWQNTLGFKLTDPVGNLKTYWQLLKNLDNREFIVDHATSSSFIDNMLAYPGGVMRDIILRFWIDNELSTGVIKFGELTAYLKDIDCSVLAVGGDTDIIVTADAVKPLMDLISSQDKTFKTVPGGHMGVVSGSQAPTSVWPEMSDWLSTRSD
ncbi:alpha/beta fold hydrolase [Acinetobacter baumannii]|nr:alpha/beta fold hydrolase [Acinetobacter baumannii]